MLQKEAATGAEAGVEAGGEACDVSGDVGQHLRTGLVVVGDLGHATGDLVYGEASTQHFAPVDVLCSRISGERDRPERHNIRIPFITWRPPGCQKDKVLDFTNLTD